LRQAPRGARRGAPLDGLSALLEETARRRLAALPLEAVVAQIAALAAGELLALARHLRPRLVPGAEPPAAAACRGGLKRRDRGVDQGTATKTLRVEGRPSALAIACRQRVSRKLCVRREDEYQKRGSDTQNNVAGDRVWGVLGAALGRTGRGAPQRLTGACGHEGGRGRKAQKTCTELNVQKVQPKDAFIPRSAYTGSSAIPVSG